MPDLQQVNIDATTDPLLILNISEMISEGQDNVDYAQFRDYVSKMAAIDSTLEVLGAIYVTRLPRLHNASTRG